VCEWIYEAWKDIPVKPDSFFDAVTGSIADKNWSESDYVEISGEDVDHDLILEDEQISIFLE